MINRKCNLDDILIKKKINIDLLV